MQRELKINMSEMKSIKKGEMGKFEKILFNFEHWKWCLALTQLAGRKPTMRQILEPLDFGTINGAEAPKN